MTASVGAPALTMMMIRRGRSSEATNLLGRRRRHERALVAVLVDQVRRVLALGAVVQRDGVPVAGEVAGEVAAHDGEAGDADGGEVRHGELLRGGEDTTVCRVTGAEGAVARRCQGPLLLPSTRGGATFGRGGGDPVEQLARPSHRCGDGVSRWSRRARRRPTASAAASPSRVISPSGGRFHSQQSRSAADPQISARRGVVGSVADEEALHVDRPRRSSVPVTRTGVTVQACMASTVAMVTGAETGTCVRSGLGLVATHDPQRLVDAVGGEAAVEGRAVTDGELGVEAVDHAPRGPADAGCSRRSCRRPTSTAGSRAAGRRAPGAAARSSGRRRRAVPPGRSAAPRASRSSRRGRPGR